MRGKSNARYKGLRRRRLRGPTYYSLVDEFCEAMTNVFPKAVVQFEDFGNTTAFHVLEAHRHVRRCFNDDIQGTACVALAGLLAAARCTGQPLREQRFLFLGAGEASESCAVAPMKFFLPRTLPRIAHHLLISC